MTDDGGSNGGDRRVMLMRLSDYRRTVLSAATGQAYL